MQKALRLRAEIIGRMRTYLDQQCGFVDIQTPTLAHFTPGGAAEFLVPANKAGECFSLPQSPQIYKQLLMCGSMDRYYQIAVCYRDEKISPFRQAEFIQLDLELSFTNQESVMDLVEQIIVQSWPDNLGEKPEVPFKKIAYSEAMLNYGSDKPDTRIPWKIVDSPVEVEGKTAKMFISRGASKCLSERNLAEWESRISDLPHKQDYAILRGNEATAGGRIKFDEEFLQKYNVNREKDAIVVCWGDDQPDVLKTLGSLRNLMAETIDLRQEAGRYNFLWVQKFPLFTRNKQTGELESSHHPFTAPIPEHVDQLMRGQDLESIEAQHYDLVLNGVEIGGGSIRIHDAGLQKYVLEDLLHLESKELQHLLIALSYGAPPHGGFALGLDRYVAILNAEGNPNASIRSVIAFPKGSQGQCFMTGSPHTPSEECLQRYGLRKITDEAKEEAKIGNKS